MAWFGRRNQDAVEVAVSAVFSAKSKASLRGTQLLATDGVLSSYAQDPKAPWHAIWETADRADRESPRQAHPLLGDHIGCDRGVGIPGYGEKPYWAEFATGKLAPLSALAFWGYYERLDVANDRQTPPVLLGLMATDPHPHVRGTIARRGYVALGGSVFGPGLP